MQSPDFPITNPLKPKQDNLNSKPMVTNKSKLNRKIILISMSIILGLLSLLIANLINQQKPTKLTNGLKPTSTSSQPQDSHQLQPDNKWQQQLNSINDQLNQNLDLEPPKIDQKITF